MNNVAISNLMRTLIKKTLQQILIDMQISPCRLQHACACPLWLSVKEGRLTTRYLLPVQIRPLVMERMQNSTNDETNFLPVGVCPHSRAVLYESARIVRCLWVSVRLPLSVIESRVALRWQLAGLILTHEGRNPAPGVTQTCQA